MNNRFKLPVSTRRWKLGISHTVGTKQAATKSKMERRRIRKKLERNRIEDKKDE